ncbi:MAG TPA: hypothetical protein VN638_02380 [Nitrospiraceae bacterium]|nr:hypothetical protein [Nitrospiraceae bacterium]
MLNDGWCRTAGSMVCLVYSVYLVYLVGGGKRPKMVCLVFLVYLVYLVGRRCKLIRETRQTR